MVTYVVGNLFESPAQVLVNTVNTVGVMGKGIAKEFKSIYPEMFMHYQAMCEANLLQVGQLWLYKSPHKWILNFPTKKHWRQPSKVEYVEDGLRKFVESYHDKGITSIAFPMLGCGNGDLDWETQVRPLMEKYLRPLMIDVYIYLYRMDAFVPEHRNSTEVKTWLQQEPRSLSFQEFMDDLQGIVGHGGLANSDDQDELRYALGLDSTSSPGLVIAQGERVTLIENAQLFDLWNTVRAVGFLTADSMPPGLEEQTRSMQLLLEKLPYFKRVLLARSYKHLNQDAVALQLTPPTQSRRTGRKLIQPQVAEIHEQGAPKV